MISVAKDVSGGAEKSEVNMVNRVHHWPQCCLVKHPCRGGDYSIPILLGVICLKKKHIDLNNNF